MLSEHPSLIHYGEVASLFDFPGPEYKAQGRSVLELLRKDYPGACTELEYFLDRIPEKTLDQQELFTRTFDVLAITTLDIGYVMFGDDYKRAELLSNLMREHHQVKNDCKMELADHLPNVLRLMPKLKDQELNQSNQPQRGGEGEAPAALPMEGATQAPIIDELVSEILLPALLLMIREFDSERIQKKNTSYQIHYKTLIDTAPGNEPTLYCHLLKSLLELLKKDFQVTEMIARLSDWSAQKASKDFLGLVEKEMEIENNANPTNSGCDA